MTIRRRGHRGVAALALVALCLALAVPAPAQATPFLLLGSAAASVASTIIVLGSYLFVANTHDSEHRPGPGLPATVACTQERDGSTLCWPASQGDSALPAEAAAPVAAPPVEDEVAVARPPERAETP
jgi:hypothetical protein